MILIYKCQSYMLLLVASLNEIYKQKDIFLSVIDYILSKEIINLF